METDKLVVKFHQELFSMHKYKLLSGTIIQLRNIISQPLECEEVILPIQMESICCMTLILTTELNLKVDIFGTKIKKWCLSMKRFCSSIMTSTLTSISNML